MWLPECHCQALVLLVASSTVAQACPVQSVDTRWMDEDREIRQKRKEQVNNDAVEILERMAYHGSCCCDKNTGDNAGILIILSQDFSKETTGCWLPTVLHESSDNAKRCRVHELVYCLKGWQVDYGEDPTARLAATHSSAAFR